MSDMSVEPTAPDSSQGPADTGTTETVATSPAWDPILSQIPSSMHPAITPTLKEWDSNFGKVQQDLARYKPWEPIISQEGLTPEQVQYGQQLLALANTDPKGLYSKLEEYLRGEGLLDDPSTAPQATGDEDYEDPKLKELSDLVQTMGNKMLSDAQMQQQQREDAALDAELKTAEANCKEQTGGRFDERYILARLQLGDSLDEAVNSFVEIAGKVEATKPSAPAILPSGGGVPSSAVNVSKLTDAERKQVIVNSLLASRTQG